jgi:peptidyl-prolyl cis-trans isomerase D
MFDFVHENKRVIQIVLGLIILPFMLWGVDSYRRSASSSEGSVLATVNGDKITQPEFDRAMRQQQDRMRELMGDKYDPEMFSKPETRQAILDNLVEQHLLMSQAHNAGLRASDGQLAQTIAGFQAFQTDGKFDKQRYESVLKSQNMSPLTFEARVRQELGMRQLSDAYVRNGYASNTAAADLIHLYEQQRVVSLAQIALEPFLKEVTVSDREVKDYYEKNTGEFRKPEQVQAEYVVFSAEALQPQMTVNEAEIKKYYDEHQPEFGTAEQRQAAHILITVSAQASEADKQAARARAEKILKEVRQSPGKFADLARQYSQDPGSAANGGDLGMFGRGVMAKPFEDAVFKLKPGEISGLVQTEFGFHIIKLLAVNPAKVEPLDAVKNTIIQRLKQQKAKDRFAELAEKFSNTAYEQSDTLKPAADLVKMPVQKSAWLSKGEAGELPWTKEALDAVFSREAVTDKRNTAAMEVAPDTLLAARVIGYKQAGTLPLAEVSGAIRQKLLQQRARELAVRNGKDTLEQLRRGENPKLDWKPGQVVTRAQGAMNDGSIVRQIFRADMAKLPAYVGVENPKGGYTLARIDAVKDVDAIDGAKLARYEQQLRQLTGEELFRAYVADARQHADINIKKLASEEEGK